MNLDSLRDYLLIGSYLAGAVGWAFLFREIKNLRREVLALRLELAFEKGKAEGASWEGRITRLERLIEGKLAAAV